MICVYCNPGTHFTLLSVNQQILALHPLNWNKGSTIMRHLTLFCQECTLNAEEAKYKNGCVNWNQYYTKCTTGDTCGQQRFDNMCPGPTNPFHGAISFDNIGLAWVAIFLVISLEGWTDVMYFVQVTYNHK